jgi:2-methylcitrate dehydratase
MTTISQQWADYALALCYEDLTPEAVAAAKLFLTDGLACALGGSQTEDFHALSETFRELGGTPECSVVGSTLRTNVRNAALINALAMRAQDYNDVYWKQDPSHPGDLLPAALCVGEREKRSGVEVMVAIVIAYELEMRLCEAAFPGIRELGWHHASLTQFASPVVAGKLLGLNREQMVNAIGISGSHNHTLGAVTAGTLTMMKNTVDPMATESGVMAALMARHGYEGPTRIFEGREGLFDSLGEEWKPEVLTDGLGQTFRITDCSIKPYPSEALTHAPISAALDLVLEHDLQPADIAEINIWTLRRAAEILADPAKYVINSRETADHSLPYCIGAAVVDRELTPHQFKRAKLSDPLILSTLKKVKAQLEPSFELRFPAEQPCRVEIKTMDGRSLTRERAYPKGDPRDPLSLEEVRGKFRALAAGVISDEQVEECFCLLDDLENLPDIGELMRGLATEPRRAAV